MNKTGVRERKLSTKKKDEIKCSHIFLLVNLFGLYGLLPAVHSIYHMVYHTIRSFSIYLATRQRVNGEFVGGSSVWGESSDQP